MAARSCRPWMRSGKAMLSDTVAFCSRLNCWKIMPIFWRASRSPFLSSAVSSWPDTKTRPLSGRSSRFISRSSVDLPAPLRPMSPSASPRATVSDTSRTASKRSPPFREKDLLSFSSRISGSCETDSDTMHPRFRLDELRQAVTLAHVLTTYGPMPPWHRHNPKTTMVPQAASSARADPHAGTHSGRKARAEPARAIGRPDDARISRCPGRVSCGPACCGPAPGDGRLHRGAPRWPPAPLR